MAVSAQEAERFQRQMKLGLGEAVLRLFHVEFRYAHGMTEIPDALRQERELIVQALNQFELDLGFDCNNDGVPDTVEIFQKSAETSCCRILPKDTSRRPAFPKAIGIPTEAPKPKPIAELAKASPAVVPRAKESVDPEEVMEPHSLAEAGAESTDDRPTDEGVVSPVVVPSVSSASAPKPPRRDTSRKTHK